MFHFKFKFFPPCIATAFSLFSPFSMLGLGISQKLIFHVINDPKSQGAMPENGPSF
jgi:hypothetical protein